ncbi:hypothetical protein N7447_006978 [Penicillium robsamsonii]|uniref:uncharacterized protein n=1 Tax=Penicillium robsamsonii TaxID=1792511 RepID=UPI002546CEBB|nr:uncharacterized protein N7447_006978 [Penicillium robsamsonii]KAJ5824638.1 hypothetical protein N7447_006978 [Penicillium robsamsonii]
MLLNVSPDFLRSSRKANLLTSSIRISIYSKCLTPTNEPKVELSSVEVCCLLADVSWVTPLSFVSNNSAEEGHIEVVKLLIATNAVQLDVKDSSNHRTPLLSSLIEEYYSISKLLLDSGAQDIDRGDIISGGRTALSIAAELGNETMCNALLDTGKVNPNSKSTYNRTPLSYASESGATSIVRRLLNTEGVEPDLADTNYGRTPLSWAAAKGHFEVVQLLLQSPGVDVNSRDFMYKRTPRSWALAHKHRDVAHVIRKVEMPGVPDDAFEETVSSEELVSSEYDSDNDVI